MQGGYDTESNLAPLLAEARATGQTLAVLLISRNLALPGVVVGALAHLAQLPAIDLAAMTPSPEAIAAMPEEVAQEFEAVALQFEGNVLAVAFAEPPSPEDVDALARRMGHRINPVLADPVVIAQSWALETVPRIRPARHRARPGSDPSVRRVADGVHQTSSSCWNGGSRQRPPTATCHSISTTCSAMPSRSVRPTSI